MAHNTFLLTKLAGSLQLKGSGIRLFRLKLYGANTMLDGRGGQGTPSGKTNYLKTTGSKVLLFGVE